MYSTISRVMLIAGYENMHGFAPADYSMNGSPGGLERIDILFGAKLYTSSFSASPIVFGAFPSLHAGWATLHSLYIHHLVPQARVALCAYVMWVWWATMYLTHHYFVDLIGGSCLAVTVFYIAQRNYLPRVQVGKLFRWHYDSVTKGHYTKVRESRSRANSAATVAAWQMNGSFVDLETGLVQGVPPNSEDEDDNWEMQEMSPAEDEIEREGRVEVLVRVLWGVVLDLIVFGRWKVMSPLLRLFDRMILMNWPLREVLRRPGIDVFSGTALVSVLLHEQSLCFVSERMVMSDYHGLFIISEESLV